MTGWVIGGTVVAALVFLFWLFMAGRKSGKSEAEADHLASNAEMGKSIREMETDENKKYQEQLSEHSKRTSHISPWWDRNN